MMIRIDDDCNGLLGLSHVQSTQHQPYGSPLVDLSSFRSRRFANGFLEGRTHSKRLSYHSQRATPQKHIPTGMGTSTATEPCIESRSDSQLHRHPLTAEYTTSSATEQ